MKPSRLAFVLLIVLAVILAFSNLGGPALWDESEAMYASVSKNMATSGDWITQTYNGEPWFVHPPLYAWSTNLRAWVLGWTEFSVRVSAAGTYILSVAATVGLGNALFGPPVGLIAGFMIATTLQLIVSAHVGVYDTMLLMWTLLALWGLYSGLIHGKRDGFLGAAAAMGLATLTKGPVGFVFPLLIALPFSLIPVGNGPEKKVPFRNLRLGTFIASAALFLAIAAPWYVIEAIRHGDAFTSYILGYQSFGRYFGAVEKQTGAWWYYLPLIPLGFLPWSGTMAGALPHLARLRKEPGGLFLIVWLGLGLLFFSIAQTKLINYVLPLYPALAIATAKLFADGQEPAARRWARLAQIAGGLFFALVAGAGLYFLVTQPSLVRDFRGSPLVSASTALGILGAPLLIMLAFGIIFALNSFFTQGAPARGVAILTAGMALAMLWVLTLSLPKIEPLRPQTKAISQIVASQLPPSEPLMIYQLNRTSSPAFYSGHHLLRFDTKADLLKEIDARISGHQPIFLLMDKQTYVQEFQDLPLHPGFIDNFEVLLVHR